MALSICIGCGCTDDCACEGGCSWVAENVGVGLCSTCAHFSPAMMIAWRWGARAAGWYPEVSGTEILLVQQDGSRLGEKGLPRRIGEYDAVANLPDGTYYCVNYNAGTVYLVDQQGLPAMLSRDQLLLKVTTDWSKVRKAAPGPSRSPDRERGKALKTLRGRAKAKAADKARQAARRRS
jgi:hypothetical protein